MTAQEHLNRIKELAARVSKEEALRIRVPAANRLLANTKNRIINEGRASDGSRIGNYSTKPAYYSRKQFVRKGSFKPVGKGGFKGERLVSEKKFRVVKGTNRIVSENKFKVVKSKPKTMYIENGYAGFRNVQGLQTQFVNMELSGDLMLSYVSVPDSNANIKQGLNTELSAKKREGLEKRFKPFLRSTKDEIADFNKECAVEFAKLTVETLR
jgi:hypothetical protein